MGFLSGIFGNNILDETKNPKNLTESKENRAVFIKRFGPTGDVFVNRVGGEETRKKMSFAEHSRLNDETSFYIEQFGLDQEGFRLKMAREYAEQLGVKGLALVIPLLKDESEYTRDAAVRIIVAVGSPATEYLLKFLNNDSQMTRYGVIGALGRIGDESAVVPLSETLYDKKKEIRAISKWALDLIINKKAT